MERGVAGEAMSPRSMALLMEEEPYAWMWRPFPSVEGLGIIECRSNKVKRVADIAVKGWARFDVRFGRRGRNG